MKETRSVFSVTTPEHVRLRLPLAEPGTRLLACALDLGIIYASILLLAFLASRFGPEQRDLVQAALTLVFFLARTFYFMIAEVRGLGQTIGKKKLGVRVVAADGGPLTAEQVVARNLTRELEIFLPITVLVAPGAGIPEAPPWVQLALFIWVAGLAALPLLNRHRARLGDLLAGTVVVVQPAGELLADLADAGDGPPDYSFTSAQLDIYGIKELQVLEDVLRRPDSMSRDELLRRILDRVVNKITWPDTVPYTEAERFLYAFYAAQRHRLEHRMLLGDRREQKVS